MPLGLGSWHCSWIRLDDDGRELVVRFGRPGTSDWIEVSVFPSSPHRGAFRTLEHCSVAYRGSLRNKDEAVRVEVAALVMAVASAVDQRLAVDPSRTIAEALGRGAERRKLVFGRDALLSLLAPDIVLGRELLGGWRLEDVYPTSHLREAASDELVLVLDFKHDTDARRMLFEVGRRDDARPVMKATANLQVSHLALGAATPAGGEALVALVAFVLDLHDHAGLEIKFPDVASDVAALLPAAGMTTPDAAEQTLNLAINADCEQSCTFCSVRELLPAADGADAAFARISADLESNLQRGVRRVRINGYDPLGYGRILDVLRHARDIGYEHADVFSPFTRLADEQFCAEVVASLPPSRAFFVPVYGANAAAHDAVVGTPGAFAKLERALDNLTKSCPDAEIRWLCVATRDGLPALLDLARYAREQGYVLSVHMPYPSSESRTDRFFSSSPQQSAVAEVAAAGQAEGLAIRVNGVLPCVYFRTMAARGVPLERWLALDDEKQRLPGTEYRDKRFVHRAKEAGQDSFHAATVPCPHVATCALSGACPREILRSYVEAFGMEEFAPVSIAELVR